MGIGPWHTDEENFEGQFENISKESEKPTLLQAMAKEAVECLTPKQRKIWRLFNNDGLTQDQIAIKLRISQPVVSKHLKAAERSLCKWGQEHRAMFNLLHDEIGPKEQAVKPNGYTAVKGSAAKTPIKRSERTKE